MIHRSSCVGGSRGADHQRIATRLVKTPQGIYEDQARVFKLWNGAKREDT